LLDVPAAVVPIWIAISVVLLLDFERWSARAPIDSAWLGVIAIALLISPRAWVYSGWFILGPALAVALSTRGRLPESWIAGALLLLPTSTAMLGQPNGWLSPLVGSLYTWTWFLLLLSARRSALYALSQSPGPNRTLLT
jgi:hypothetical protein